MNWGAVALALVAVVFGYLLGTIRARAVSPPVNLTGRELRVVIEWRGIEKLLDERGLIAVPKGVDLLMKGKRPERSEGHD